MRLKLDENLGERGRKVLQDAGHHVSTVVEQGMQQAADSELIKRCGEEGRCLVTLDLDFSNPLVFVPSQYAGIAVLRISPKSSRTDLLNLMMTLAQALKNEPIEGKLWIVEPGRIRIYQEKSTD